MQVPGWYQRDVSRETLDKLDEYAALLRKWTAGINLVSKSSVQDLEHRHIWDSAQTYRPFEGVWLDLGSGGGLPGVVTSILAQGEGNNAITKLVESDQRKAVFLRTCARELSIPCSVEAKRIEDLIPMQASIVSARALADLAGLLDLSVAHLADNGRCLFMKGASWRDEIKTALKTWQFSYEATPSKTNSEAVILEVKEIERV